MSDQKARSETTDKATADAIEEAILIELRKWDGGEMLPKIAGPLANHLRRRVLATLYRHGVKIT